MTHAQSGDVVRIHFTGRLENGSIFGSSEDEAPIQLTLDSEQMIEGLNRALVGMQVGEKKSITIAPEEGFGPRRPELQQQMPRTALPEGVRVGDRLLARAGETPLYVWVRDLEGETATVDGNHPLAGQILLFDVELVSIEPAIMEKPGME